MCVYQACVLLTLLYSSEWVTIYARQEQRLNGFHLRCLRCPLHIRWQDRVPNTKVLEHAGSLSMSLLLIQRHLRWFGHAYCMEPTTRASSSEICNLRRGKNAQPLRGIPQGASAPPATETATPGSGYTVIQGPSQIPSANHRLFKTRMPLL